MIDLNHPTIKMQPTERMRKQFASLLYKANVQTEGRKVKGA